MSTASRPVTQLYRLLRLALPLSILWMTACTAENPDADVDDDEEVDMGDEEDDPDGSADGSTDVPDMSGGDPNLAIAAECQKLSVAVCDRLAACSKYYLRTYYGDLATCQSRVRLTCDPYVKLTGSSWTVERLRSCTMGYAGGTCDDYFAPGGPAACRPQPGQLANSAVCANSNQCKSANCAVGTGGCGTCTTAGKLGEACSAAQPCDLGLSCASGKCAAEGGAGAACGTGRAAERSARIGFQSPSSQPGNPPDGSQPSVTANSRASSMPNQKFGIATPSWVNAITPASPARL